MALENSDLIATRTKPREFGTHLSFPIPTSHFSFLVFIILGILLWPTLLWSKDEIRDSSPGLTASLDRDSARLGSVVVLTLSYRLPEGASLPADPEIKGLEDLTIVGREMGPGQISIRLLIDQVGTWKSEPLSVAYLDKQGKVQTLKSEPVSLKVLSNLGEKPEEAQLRPIQGIIPIKPGWLEYLPWGATLLAILLAVFSVAFWLKKRRSRRESFELQEPPHIRARKEIEMLEEDGLFEKGYIKEFYFRFSEIIRRYLESLRGFPAAEFTTEEIASYLEKEQDRMLLPLLRQADLIKFADAIPTPARKDEHVQRALLYIQETSPVSENGNTTEIFQSQALIADTLNSSGLPQANADRHTDFTRERRNSSVVATSKSKATKTRQAEVAK